MVDFRCKVVGISGRQIRRTKPSADAEGAFGPRKEFSSIPPRKASQGSVHCDRT